MYERQDYKNPPIQEAVCEFMFANGDWDPTTPGKLFEVMGGKYSATPKPVKKYHAQIGAGPTIAARASIRELPSLTKFSTPDELMSVTVGPQFLSVSMGRPYSDWETLQEQILDAYEKYREVTSADEVLRVGIRYINHIVIDSSKPVVLKKYFKCVPQDLSDLKHPDLPVTSGALLSRNVYGFTDSIRMNHMFGTTDSPEGTIGVLLDIDVYWQQVVGESPDVAVLIERLRLRERVAFEASIKDACRRLFK
jgi:uncharacterized protein (TIGR04255 family)